MKKTPLLIVLLTMFFLALPAFAADFKPLKPKPTDKCPVCGMFVAKYSDFAAQIRFKDGSAVFFDGAKDMFRYYHGPTRFNPAKKQTDIAALYVTGYYSLNPINAVTAWYVTGSNVFGPMGRELIPFEKESEALDFKKDHKGKSILRFRGVTPAITKALE
jgi:copper chaperone NosL